MIFADSSAVVKRYVPEGGSEFVSGTDDPLVIAHITRVEVAAAIWRKHRLGELTQPDAALLVDAFEHDYYGDSVNPPRFDVIPVTEERLRVAARMAARHGLRAYDAVQLASAEAARSGAVGEQVRFLAFDDQLRSAASMEGFELVPVD